MNLNSLSQKITKPVSMSHREPMVYVERAKIAVKDNNVVAFSKSGFTNELRSDIIPVASIGCLFLGPGTSITNEAVKIISRRECCLLFCGGGGIPIYNYSANYRSPKNQLKQATVALNNVRRLQAVKFLLTARNHYLLQEDTKMDPAEIDSCSSVQDCFLVEARWAKKFYEQINTKFGILGENKYVKLTNFMCYALVTPLILNLGFDPNMGIMHGNNRGGGLIFDIADLIKGVCSVRLSASAIRQGLSENQLKASVIQTYKDHGFQKKCIATLTKIYELDT
jgi:CRISPR-associated protein Cas1